MSARDVLSQLSTPYCPRECYDAVAELVAAAKDAAKWLDARVDGAGTGKKSWGVLSGLEWLHPPTLGRSTARRVYLNGKGQSELRLRASIAHIDATPAAPSYIPREYTKEDRELCANCGLIYEGHIHNLGNLHPCWKPSGLFAENRAIPSALTPLSERLAALARIGGAQ